MTHWAANRYKPGDVEHATARDPLLRITPKESDEPVALHRARVSVATEGISVTQQQTAIATRIADLRLTGFPGLSSTASLLRELLDTPAALREAVNASDWPRTELLGIRSMGVGYAALRVFQGTERMATRRLRTAREIDGDLAVYLDQPAGADGRGLAAGLGRGNHLPPHGHDVAIVSLSRGLLGVVHAAFNLTLRSVQSESSAHFHTETTNAFQRIVEEVEALIRAGQLRIYHRMTSRAPTDDVVEEACALAGIIEQSLPRLARPQAKVFVAMQRLREEGKGGAAENLGRLAMRAGALTREATAAHAASYRIALNLLRDEPDVDVLELYDKAADLAFDTKLPNGKDTQLAHMGRLEGGEFVEVEGFATRVEAIQPGGSGLVSRIELLDPSSQTRARAAALFMHLPHLGVTDGAFCRLSGIFRKNSALLDDSPGIEVDRLSLADLSDKSWRIAFLRSARRWYQPWRNGLNMHWSLGPHQSAAEPRRQASVEGAGELIYLDFMKDLIDQGE
ncbi:hypothetical protein [Nitrococcus mobilis]|uniref:Uncharacterized protein n=1 Tax=Nitrococcus mobilis Nb-231 TaxID=314278 RepID=A4BPV0_9GAMM|nr:hypothetical protein [Nitrococcus mobilis]EAR22105.1 hypothetical protein NB231_04330 [Nitrococcus mobilis Nb-231]